MKNIINNNNIKINKSELQQSNELIRNIENIPEINECEYVYIDEAHISTLKTNFLKDKIIITENNLNEYYMFETSDIHEKQQNINMTKLDSKHIVDLVILNNHKKYPKMNEIIDKDTIITKNLGKNIFYLENIQKDLYSIITENEKITIKGRGTNTQLVYYKNKKNNN